MDGLKFTTDEPADRSRPVLVYADQEAAGAGDRLEVRIRSRSEIRCDALAAFRRINRSETVGDLDTLAHPVSDERGRWLAAYIAAGTASGS